MSTYKTEPNVMDLCDFKAGEHYVSKKLEIHKCVHVVSAICSSYKFIDSKYYVKSNYDSKKNALKKYLLKHEFSVEYSSAGYKNNQSITEFFDLIIHSNSILSKHKAENIKLNIISQNNIAIIDYEKNKFIASIYGKNTTLVENIKYEKARPINEKISRLKKALRILW